MRARVVGCARLHFGFQNLAPERDRLYGSLGVTLNRPRVIVEAEPAADVTCNASKSISQGTVKAARISAEQAVSQLGIDGTRVTVKKALPRHVGLGSGTQLALCTLSAVARAHDRTPSLREHAAKMGRGGRSGIGIAAFEDGGFIIDGGFSTTEYTAEELARGVTSTPPVTVRKEIPDEWRFLLVVPDAPPGKNGDDEETSMRAVLRRADPSIADRIGATVAQRVLPALADEDIATFGAAIGTVDHLNGLWYTDEQGDIYRPPVGAIIGELADSPAVFGAGQSSWGPAVYGITTDSHAEAAREAGYRALSRANTDGDVRVVRGRNRGAITKENDQIIKD